MGFKTRGQKSEVRGQERRKTDDPSEIVLTQFHGVNIEHRVRQLAGGRRAAGRGQRTPVK